MSLAGMKRLVQVLSIGALLLIQHAVAAGNMPVLASVPLDLGKFDDKAVEAFIGNAQVAFPEEFQPQAVDVSDRIFTGLEAAARRLVLPNGITLDWGFKPQEASLQTVVIYDPSGHPKLLAAPVNAAGIVARGNEPRATTPAQYQRVIGKYGKPMVSVFVRDQRDLAVYLPYLKRWLQADLLGMNANCSQPGMAEACRFSSEVSVSVPMRVFLLANKRKPQLLGNPSVQAADIPLEAFTQ